MWRVSSISSDSNVVVVVVIAVVVVVAASAEAQVLVVLEVVLLVNDCIIVFVHLCYECCTAACYRDSASASDALLLTSATCTNKGVMLGHTC